MKGIIKLIINKIMKPDHIKKRPASDIQPTTNKPDEKRARLFHMDVTVATTSDKCYLTTEIIPFEIRKYILSFCEPSLRTLSLTSRVLNDCINQDKLHTLTVNYNPEDPFDPFKPEVLPDFNTGNLKNSVSLYLYSLTHLDDPICVYYKNMFNSRLNIYIRLWLKNGFTFEKLEDHYKLTSNNTVVTLHNNQNIHILVLGKLIKKFFKNDNLIPDSPSKNDACHLVNVFNYIQNNQSHSTLSSLIPDAILRSYQELSLGLSEVYNLRLLSSFSIHRCIDIASAQKLKSYVIIKLDDPSASLLHLNLLSLLTTLIDKQGLKLNDDDIKFLKNFAIAKLHDPSVSPLLHSNLLPLILALMNKQELKLSDNDIEFLKNFAIAKLHNPSASPLHFNLLSLLRVLMGKQELKLSDDDIKILKNFAIAKLHNPSASPFYSNLLFLLRILMDKQGLKLSNDDIEFLKNFAIAKLHDPSASPLYSNLLFLLRIPMDKQGLKLSDDDIEFLKNFAIEKLHDPSASSLHYNLLGFSFNLIEKYSLKLNDNDILFLKNYALAELQKPKCALGYQEFLLCYLSFITKAKELFPLVSVEFFEAVHSLILEKTPKHSKMRTQTFVKFYELFLTHPNKSIARLAANICLLIDDIILDDADLTTQV